MARILELDGLCFKYPDGAHALKHLSFVVDEGDKLALIGANGSGKSTLLLNCIGCFMPRRGELRYRGVKVGKGAMKWLREKVGLLFQNPDDQLFMPTVREDIAFGPRNMSLGEAEIAHRVDEALRVMDIERLADRTPWKLSGGEKRLCALAGVYAMRPELYLLDEPTSDLDPRARRNFIELAKRLDETMIIATHDLDMALEVCKRAVILSDGNICGDGFVHELLNDGDFLRAHGLEPPLGAGA